MDQTVSETTAEPIRDRPRSRLRIGDFELQAGRIVLIQTGNSATIDRALLAEVAIWVGCYLAVRLAALRHIGRARRSIWFTPSVPHPRYMVRIAAIWAGIRVAPNPETADAAFFFEDATSSVPPSPQHARAYNFDCGDISKGRVARVFGEVFGYPLAVDPATWRGPAVEKSEANGTHDGRIVECPTPARAGFVYQRVIDTVEDGLSIDLRTHAVGGRVVAVWIKRRHAAARFQPANVSVTRTAPEAVFTAAEQTRIATFTQAMGADWAGLDILRDRSSGRIYIVDVNKTDAGPIIALSLADKLRSVATLARALTALIDQPSSVAASVSTRSSKAA